MIETETRAAVTANDSPAKAWLRALDLTASIPRNRSRILPTILREQAAQCGNAPALLSDRECFTYREVFGRANQYARWAIEQGIKKGDVVGLLMTNRPEYFAIWLGITSVGGIVALLNTNLAGSSLAHCIHVARPRQIIVSSGFVGAITNALPEVEAPPSIWAHGSGAAEFPRIDLEIQQWLGEEVEDGERPPLSIDDLALYIYTSGTTGLPKAVKVSHARVLQWSYWFAGMMGLQADDRIYSCLPMYHSIGGVLVPGAALVSGGSVVVREKFSASQFWIDVVRWDCTIMQYIGEFCRYLLHACSSPDTPEHRLRLACGNGLGADVWDEFKERFAIPRILEFYASTEGGVSLFNAEGKRGAIGRIPPYLTHRFAPALVRFDVVKEEPVRNAEGFCIPCGVNEAGEALAKVVNDPSGIGSKFDGYTDEAASEKKTLRDVFKPGDMWIRTGDLMRKDEKGFFYFVDRIGDTFRWKGENVSTSEVAAVICAFPGVKHANVYGVAIAGKEGRAGMAAVVTDRWLDLAVLRSHLVERLPSYARPVFLRFRDDVEVTGTFKYSKSDLVKQGYDPAATTDIIYFDHPELQEFRQVDTALCDRIRGGNFRL